METQSARESIIALRNEKGSYNWREKGKNPNSIIALRNEKGSYNRSEVSFDFCLIIAL